MRRENMRSDVDELALDVAASIEAMGCEDDAAFALLPAGIEEYSDEHAGLEAPERRRRIVDATCR